ncbi:MAG: class I SAM-dependent methyltransferase [Gammaproteobacteria bacterium]|nr:class I SAM-dependent methyltransferase [Gammaproteobacteria bacterium]
MNIQDITNNDFIQDKSSVWVLKQHEDFAYSDGRDSEKYLEYVFTKADDLSSSSTELESYIKDWPSEYHLTTKRARLFAGFDFDASKKVLEVGGGCGAITRYLGETFNHVVSIEGSINRARLASLRTEGLDSVSIICAPFQEIEFTEKFDIIFCVGVYEYSASFVSGEDPYHSVLNYFSNMLTPDGVIVIAIENQFGLKYFNAAREDHTRTLYEGIEGYHRHGHKVKTFGKYELEDNLKDFFPTIQFYYPYPDYKLPSCIISDDFLSQGHAGELVSQIKSRDYYGELSRPWNEALVSMELSKNGMLPFFANSFLVFAGKAQLTGISFNQLAITTTSDRVKQFRTQTRIYKDDNGDITVSKKALSGESAVAKDKLTMIESSSAWNDEGSLQSLLYSNCMSKKMSLNEIFLPCKAWVEYLASVAEHSNGEKYLDGHYIDSIFPNIYLESTGITIIDKEWVWEDNIKLNVIVIRAIFIFLDRVDRAKYFSKHLQVRSLRKMIKLIAQSIGITLTKDDFSDFIKLESEYQSLVYNSQANETVIRLQLILFDCTSYYFVYKQYWQGRVFFSKIKKFVSQVIRKL